MKTSDLHATVDPAENPDWGFARTKRILLRRANCEFGQSAFCAHMGNHIVPNRDYIYEGLSAVINGENWKFLDGLGFGLKKADGQFLKLTPTQVTVTPWNAYYTLAISENGKHLGTLGLDYYLLRNNTPTLSVQAELQLEGIQVTLSVIPLADLRFMYASSSPDATSIELSQDRLVARKDGRVLSVKSKNFLAARVQKKVIDWNYKLGFGERAETDSGTGFIMETRRIVWMGEIESAFLNNRTQIQCHCLTDSDFSQPNWLSRSHDLKAELLEQSRAIKGVDAAISNASANWGNDAAVALAGRTCVLLTKFDYASTPAFPDAGAYWFRNPWFRDVFETAVTNFPLLYQLEKRRLKSWVTAALKLEKNGLIPNKLPESRDQTPSYTGLDATVLCYLTGLKYAKESNDAKLRSELKRKVLKSIRSFREDGGPVKLHENGLLSCPAAYGWLDAYFIDTQTGLKVPGRLPEAWAREIIDASGNAQHELETKHYFLAEVNAAWMRFLQDVARMAGGNEVWATDLIELIKENYAKTFWRNGFVSHIVDAQTGNVFQGDALEGNESSAGIVATALLPEIFAQKQVDQVLHNAKNSIFVSRENKLFGVIVKNSLNQRTYYNDRQYHQSVVWPRDTPYLIKLLQRSSLPESKALIQQVLLSNLEHQMQEGAMFYNQELFSLPIGNNPHPVPLWKDMPVPVKNPAQLWSQWVQPYIDELGNIAER